MDLSAIPMRETSHRGIRIHLFQRDPETGRVVALIAMDPGCAYPAHRHRGTEDVYVLQGGYTDGRATWRAGAHVHYEDGSTHTPVALREGPTCILFAIAEKGVEVL